jgi:DNA repair ATPase RecN
VPRTEVGNKPSQTGRRLSHLADVAEETSAAVEAVSESDEAGGSESGTDDGGAESPVQELARVLTAVAELQRHLDTVLVELEETAAALDADDPEYAHTRGRLVAVRDAERSLARLANSGESFLDHLGDSHHTLHQVLRIEG